jgi:aldose sugar dehydrogenase
METAIYYWTPSIAPSGMIFVRGDKYPGWEGNILLGALAGTHVSRLELSGENVVNEEKLLDGMGRVRDVSQSPDGYIYISFEKPGKIVRLTPGSENN